MSADLELQETLMNTYKLLSVLVAASLLAACASSSGALAVGPDTYLVSNKRSAWSGGPEGAKKDAIVEANAHCSSMGKEVLVTNIESRNRGNEGAGSADVYFRCLQSGDPELQRPNYERAPDTVIEDRRS